MQCNPSVYCNYESKRQFAAHEKTRHTHRTLLQLHEPVDTRYYVSKILGALLRLCFGRYSTGPLFYVSTPNSLQPSGYYMCHQFNT